MSEHTLLVILVTVLAVSWVLIAAVVVAIGWQLYRIIRTVETAAKDIEAGVRAALREVSQVKEGIKMQGARAKTAARTAFSMLTRTPTPRRRKPPVDAEETVL